MRFILRCSRLSSSAIVENTSGSKLDSAEARSSRSNSALLPVLALDVADLLDAPQVPRSGLAGPFEAGRQEHLQDVHRVGDVDEARAHRKHVGVVVQPAVLGGVW